MLRSNWCDYGNPYIVAKGPSRVREVAARDIHNRRLLNVHLRLIIIKSTMLKTLNKMIVKHHIVSDNILEIYDNFLHQVIQIQDSASFKCMKKFTESLPDIFSTNNVEIGIPLKYLSNFQRNLELN